MQKCCRGACVKRRRRASAASAVATQQVAPSRAAADVPRNRCSSCWVGVGRGTDVLREGLQWQVYW